MSGKLPEEQVRGPHTRHRWLCMSFLHWAYEPAAVQKLLPPELEVHTHDNSAWVGLTPFLMADFRPMSFPPLPLVSTFPETNLRTYVKGPDGKDGLWFFSLDTSSLATVLAARVCYGVPYHWATMTLRRGNHVRYVSRRRTGQKSAAEHDITIVPGHAISETEQTPFDD